MDAVVSAAVHGGISWYDTTGLRQRSLRTGPRDRDCGTQHQAGRVLVATKWLPILKPASDLGRNIVVRTECLAPYPVDLYQVHLPWSVSSVSAQMRAMAALVHGSQVRAVGVSNFSARQMAKAGAALQAEGVPLASNQVRISLLDRRIETNGVLELARKHRVTLIAYSPLAQGVLTGRFHDDPSAVQTISWGRRSWLSPSSFLTRKGLERTAPLISGLREVGETHGATPAQVALAWLITYYGEAVVAIPGASRPKQAAEAATAMDVRLTGAEVERIDRLSSGNRHQMTSTSLKEYTMRIGLGICRNGRASPSRRSLSGTASGRGSRCGTPQGADSRAGLPRSWP